MVNRTAKFASAIFASIVAGAPITIIPSSAAVGADDCLTEPGKKTPQGQHWYYRFEHGTKRQCWYLRGDGDGSTQAGSSAKAAAPSQTNEAAAARSAADAYDELPASRVRGEQDGGAFAAARQAPAIMPIAANPEVNQDSGAGAGPSATAPVDSVPQSLVASRWPEPSAVNSSINPAPEASATMIADAKPTPQPEPSPALAPASLAEAAAPAEKPAGSFQMVLLVILGALALASVTASVVYRFGRARHVVRVTARRRDIRQSADQARRPPWADMEPENLAVRADVALPSDFAPRGYAADARPIPAFATDRV
jgi:hypothetical protein